MLLPEMFLRNRINKRWKYSGMDSLLRCRNKRHFLQYPYNITYEYNSRGFRDDEWPVDNLKDTIWCFGDSFTVGLGNPLSHTWPIILQHQADMRCINISMDGASNKWIARQVKQVIETIQPKNIVIQWSFLERHESENILLSDEDRRIILYSMSETFLQRFHRFKNVINIIPKSSTNVVHTFIPHAICNYAPPLTSTLTETWNNIKGIDWPPDFPNTFNDFNNLDVFIKKELIHFKEYKNLKRFNTIPLLLKKITNSSHLIIMVEHKDLARDGFHYDKLSASECVTKIIPLLK